MNALNDEVDRLRTELAEYRNATEVAITHMRELQVAITHIRELVERKWARINRAAEENNDCAATRRRPDCPTGTTPKRSVNRARPHASVRSETVYPMSDDWAGREEGPFTDAELDQVLAEFEIGLIPVASGRDVAQLVHDLRTARTERDAARVERDALVQELQSAWTEIGKLVEKCRQQIARAEKAEAEIERLRAELADMTTLAHDNAGKLADAQEDAWRSEQRLAAVIAFCDADHGPNTWVPRLRAIATRETP